MNPLENHGIIIRELRRLQGLSVRKAAEKISRGIGWLSEIENGVGTARLTETEFDRIVDVLEGRKHWPMFRTWVANFKNRERVDKTFDGAVLKFIRRKKGLNLRTAARLIGLSYPYLSKLECGIKPMTLARRVQIIRAYGYQPSSFKNLSTDPVRSKTVPLHYKMTILLRSLQPDQLDELFQKALAQKT